LDDQASKERVSTISPLSELQRKIPEGLSERTAENLPTISIRIAHCTSYLSLYNLLNDLKNSIDQHAAVLQISQYLSVVVNLTLSLLTSHHPLLSQESSESSKWYQTFLDSQGGAILFVRWLRDLSQHVQSLSPDAIIIKLIQAKFPSSSPSSSSTSTSLSVFHQDRLTYDGRIYVLSMIQLLDRVSPPS
jgi:hypothetical protein